MASEAPFGCFGWYVAYVGVDVASVSVPRALFVHGGRAKNRRSSEGVGDYFALAFDGASCGLLATHSPFVVQQCGVKPLSCFRSDEKGTHITTGSEHPMLKEWDGIPNLGVVFAAGVLE